MSSAGPTALLAGATERRRSAAGLGRALSLLNHAVLIGLSVLMVGPFFWMISASLKTEVAISRYPPEILSQPIMWSNYLQAIQTFPFGVFAFNSVKIATLATIGTVLSSMLAAFAYARMDFPGKRLLFSIQLATLMIPGVVHIIPAFMIMKTLGWINTHYPLIVPHFLGGAFGTFLLRQFFLTIPREYDDAAKIDGAGYLVILARIYAPLAKPALATLGVFTFMASWNDFLGPIIYLTSEKLMTLQVGLQYFRGQYQIQTNLLMAGAVITVAPIVGIYVVAQKYFVQGVTMSGLKG